MIDVLLYVGQKSTMTDVVVWVVGGVVLLALVVLLLWQQKTGRQLAAELQDLDKLRKHKVEHEFVLKAMRLAAWHIDVGSRTLTYDNDFRGRTDSIVAAPGTPLGEAVALAVAGDTSRVEKALDDLCTGRAESFHEIYRTKGAQGDATGWAEGYATVAERDDDGNPVSIVGASLRIDERKAMEDALVVARNRAEESDRLKSAFVANMSHEIRTPLNAIIGFTSVLPDITSDEERRQLIDLIQENNQKLLRIIDDVMTISKIEAGKEQLTMTTFDLNLILTELMDRYTPRVTPGVSLLTDFGAAEQPLTTDLQHLTEALDHLVQNAVKFTQQGSVTLGYDAPANGRVRIWVRDTGKGIAKENHERIFERFYKVDEFIPGAGLGLSLCRTVAYSLGGTVGVESELGQGATFWMELPV